MRRLIVYPTFLCPFACKFCFNKDKILLNEYMNLELLNNFLRDNSKLFDEIYISGGEPMNYPKDYFNELVEIIKCHNKNIKVLTYPFDMNNYRNDIDYIVSYDFLAKPRSTDVWHNLFFFEKPFDVQITMHPLLFNYHPNSILKKFSRVPNIKSLELKPYYRSIMNDYAINENIQQTFFKLWLQSKLDLPFLNINREYIKYINDIPNHYQEEKEEYCLLPDMTFSISSLDDKGRFTYEAIDIQDIETKKSNKLSLYTDDIIEWSKSIF